MSDRPCILHVISELDIGGAELHLVKLLPYLQPAFDNHVACLIGCGPVGGQLTEAGIPVHCLKAAHQFDLRAIIAVRRLVREVSPRAVVTNLLHADIVTRLAVVGLPIPLISNQRSSLAGRSYLRLPDRLTRWAVRQYVVQTPHMQHVIERQVGAASSRISVIPNIATPPTPAQVPHVGLVITCVGNLRSGKGHEYLIRAMANLKPETYPVKVLLVGDGPAKKRLQQLAQQLRIADIIQFLGRRHDVPNILASSDIFVLPSEAEGMSNALLEAMATGLPCVAANISANRAIITHRQTGLLFLVNNVDDLARNLEYARVNRAAAAQLGEAARQYILQYHNPQRIAGQWRALLEKVLV